MQPKGWQILVRLTDLYIFMAFILSVMTDYLSSPAPEIGGIKLVMSMYTLGPLYAIMP